MALAYPPKGKPRTKFCEACDSVAVSKRDPAGKLCKWCLRKIQKGYKHKSPSQKQRLARHRMNTYNYQWGKASTLGLRD